MICFKDIQPTWNTLGFDKDLDCIPTTTLSRYAEDPLDLGTAICFSISENDENNEHIYYYLHTDTTVKLKHLQVKRLLRIVRC